ncbi:MFS transporter [Cohnella fermenti]|uniref:MFS transporter n=1 Tax=Cohnella fermenti TaxID=2565925 RepID=A0A4S4BGD2_9BACL|nr:MFS transporter [Cohnella fermenti]THF73475.1 MFS transporter [Cohnella fermenti]
MTTSQANRSAAAATLTVMPVLLAVSFSHMMNDSMQAVVPALYTVLEQSLHLSYVQVGWITFVLNMTSSVLQPVVGSFTDRSSKPYLMTVGMVLSLLGMVGIALAPSFWYVLVAAMFIGFGSAIFHPEGSRVVYLAAGNRRGFAQSVYQVGGNTGSSLAPLMALAIFVPLGQIGALWGCLFAAAAIAAMLICILPWYKSRLREQGERKAGKKTISSSLSLSGKQVAWAMALLVFIVFGRSWYHTGISNYYQFFMIDHYGLTARQAQVPVFIFLITGVLGTYFGGVFADRIGLKKMIVLSIAGAIPFSLALPYLPLAWAYVDIAVLGFILLSGFSVAVVYAQHLMPSKVGLASGLTTGLAFGMGAIGAVVLGKAADIVGMTDVMRSIAFLPFIGLLALLLPSDRRKRA